MESMFSSLAQFDNEVKAERTRVGMTSALELGRWTFQAPVGFLNGSRGGPSLTPDPQRADLVRAAFEELASGRFTKREVLDRVNARGLTTRHGRPLTPQTFCSLLRNPVYAGRVVVKKFGVASEGDFEPLVSEELFRRVQAQFTRPDAAQARYTRAHPDFPLRRFVRCAKCDTPLTGSWSRGRLKRYAYYHCSECGGVRAAKHELEATFVDLLGTLQPRAEFLDLFDAVVLDSWRERQRGTRSARSKLEQERARLQGRLEKLEEAFLYAKTIDRETFDRQRDRIREQLAVNEVAADDAANEELDVEGLLGFARTVLTDASRLWGGGTLEQKQRLQSALFPEGIAFDGSKFGTAVTCLAFAQLPAFNGANEGLASPTGFETGRQGEPSSEPTGKLGKALVREIGQKAGADRSRRSPRMVWRQFGDALRAGQCGEVLTETRKGLQFATCPPTPISIAR